MRDWQLLATWKMSGGAISEGASLQKSLAARIDKMLPKKELQSETSLAAGFDKMPFPKPPNHLDTKIIRGW